MTTPGFATWFTGLPCAGKTTLANLVARELVARRLRVDVLDGDVVRQHLSRDLGFSRADRDANIDRIGWVASRLVRVGAAAVVAAVSPYEEARQRARAVVEEYGRFVEVHVATPLDVCEQRDTKGMYARARDGKLPAFTGVSDPYEEPISPDLRLDTVGRSPVQCAALVLAKLEALGLTPNGP